MQINCKIKNFDSGRFKSFTELKLKEGIRKNAEVCGVPVNISNFNMIGARQNVMNLSILDTFNSHL